MSHPSRNQRHYPGPSPTTTHTALGGGLHTYIGKEKATTYQALGGALAPRPIAASNRNTVPETRRPHMESEAFPPVEAKDFPTMSIRCQWAPTIGTVCNADIRIPWTTSARSALTDHILEAHIKAKQPASPGRSAAETNFTLCCWMYVWKPGSLIPCCAADRLDQGLAGSGNGERSVRQIAKHILSVDVQHFVKEEVQGPSASAWPRCPIRGCTFQTAFRVKKDPPCSLERHIKDQHPEVSIKK
ncbi:hypothetical protein BKA70DRAFT_1217431 [Coprinopsis sp. MPI-PUGE-AT-0042]|nr:hypothetical protein BKA70DRAFT_1217431 [Coprinopsis sp. MPI-PUGE-AT-0042]